MPPKYAEPLKTESGEVVPNAPMRVQLAQRELTRGGYSRAREVLMETFGVCKRTAELDIREAYRLIAEDAAEERPSLRAREVERMTRIADLAEQAGELGAVIAASARIAKLNGLDVDVVQSGGVTPEQQAMLSALQMTPIERRARADELRARIAAESTPPIAAVDAGVDAAVDDVDDVDDDVDGDDDPSS